MMKGLKGPSRVANGDPESVNSIFKSHLRKKHLWDIIKQKPSGDVEGVLDPSESG